MKGPLWSDLLSVRLEWLHEGSRLLILGPKSALLGTLAAGAVAAENSGVYMSALWDTSGSMSIKLTCKNNL